jgi:hypothetical protein
MMLKFNYSIIPNSDFLYLFIPLYFNGSTTSDYRFFATSSLVFCFLFQGHEQVEVVFLVGGYLEALLRVNISVSLFFNVSY